MFLFALTSSMLRFARGLDNLHDLRLALLTARLRRFPEDLPLRHAAAELHGRRGELQQALGIPPKMDGL